MGKRLSIKEISEQAGVSVATVSRVIHQNGRFSAETEKRVKAVIESQQFTPDVIAQSMRTKKMPIVAVIMTDILDERAALFARSAQAQLSEHGFQMVIFNSKRDRDATLHFIRMMRAQHTAGFLYLSDCNITADCFGQTPVVFCWEDPVVSPSAPYGIARFDYRKGGYIGTDHLFKCGCKKVAILRGNVQFTSQIELYKGYLSAYQEHGLTPDPALSYNLDFLRTAPSIEMLTERLSSQKLPFDGLLCCSYRLAIVAMSVLQNLGLQTPQDLRFVGFSGMRMSRYGLMKYSAITEDEEALGVKAVNMLVELIEKGSLSERLHIADVGFSPGFST